jgi:hypothetical protein
MNRIRTIVLLASVATAASAATEGRYENDRYAYSIAYPAALIPEPESDNGDGRAFHSADGTVKALVWGSYNASGESPAQLAKEAESDCTAAPAYQRITRTFFAVSCRAGSNIVYQKTLIATDLLTNFQITYPAAAQGRWGAIVTAMSASMRTPR